MDQPADTATAGVEVVPGDLRIDGVRAASSVYERTVQLCEARRDAAEKAWRDAEEQHRRLAGRGDDSWHAHQMLELAGLRVQVAAERYAAAVDRLAAAVMVRRACVDGLTGALSLNFGMDALRHEATGRSAATRH